MQPTLSGQVAKGREGFRPSDSGTVFGSRGCPSDSAEVVTERAGIDVWVKRQQTRLVYS
jgi:hypothetical protein